MTAPMPHVDLVDPSDAELVTICRWYHEQVSNMRVDRESRCAIATVGFQLLAERIQARIDFEKTKHMQFREYIRQPRVREPGEEFAVPSRGEI